MTRIVAVGAVLSAFIATMTWSQAPNSTQEPASEEPVNFQELAEQLARIKKEIGQLEGLVGRIVRDEQIAHIPKPQALPSPPPIVIPEVKGPPEGLAAPIYTDPPQEQFTRMVGDIERRIVRLKDEGHAEESTKLDEQLKAIRNLARGEYSVTSEVPEIHAVGFYEASSAHHAIAPAAVRVTYVGAPIILVLMGYESIEWNVDVAKDVRIDQVIVGGGKQQDVKGLPEGIPVWNSTQDEDRRYRIMAYARQEGGFENLVHSLRKLTGRSLLTFQGSYRYSGKPVVVGPENQEWRVQHLIAQMGALHTEATREELETARAAGQDVRFEGINLIGGGTFGHEAKAAWSQFTANGPIVETMQALPTGFQRAAYDAKDKVWYGMTGDGLVRLESGTDRPRAISMEGVPRLSHGCGITFDSKQRRVIVCSFGGDGYLYTYDVDKKKWAVLASMQGTDASSICYSPEYDAIFGVVSSFGDGAVSLVEWTPKGAMVDSKRLDIKGVGGHRPDMSFQLLAAGHQLVLLAPGGRDENTGQVSPGMTSFVINPETAEVVYSAKLTPQKAEAAAP